MALVAPAQGPTPADGRLARGARTRRALAEALIALIEQGDAQPTARRVAARAGVSPRLVFHHFEDMEQVLQAAVGVQVERHWRHLEPVDSTAALPGRISRLVRRRATLYERIGPVRRAAAMVESTSPTLAAELAHSRRHLRHHVESAFAVELDGAGRRRGEVLDSLDLATSWESWEHLRSAMGRSPAGAGAVVRRLVHSIIGPIATDGGTP
ncbi:MAG TPA: TetR/AcrR family transcriptional regulator [Acidimicrobiales bacterium]|nr:TetR/AcrR family transcriptional regulator [Acidimicrobiales bacterium]